MPVRRLCSLSVALLLGLLLPSLLQAAGEWGKERPGMQKSEVTSAGQSQAEVQPFWRLKKWGLLGASEEIHEN